MTDAPRESPYELSGYFLNERVLELGEAAWTESEDIKDAMDDVAELMLDEARPARRAFLALGEVLYADAALEDFVGTSLHGWVIASDRHRQEEGATGNASGGRFAMCGRRLMVRAPNGTAHNILLSLSSYSTGKEDDAGTLAVLGFVDEKQSLQVLSRNPGNAFDDEQAVLVHLGRIGLGEGGAVGRDRVIGHLAREAPWMVEDDEIIACRLSAEDLTGARAGGILLRLAALAVLLTSLRDEVRAERRAKR